MFGYPTSAASTPTTASEKIPIVVLIVALISMPVIFLKSLKLGEENIHLILHCSVRLIGGCDFSCMFGGSGCAFVFVDFEAHNNLIYNGVGVGVVEDKFADCSTGLSELKASFFEFVFKIFPSLVR